MIDKLLKLIFWWATCDLGLQTSFMATYKSPLNHYPDVSWQSVLGSHALINGWGVLMATGSVWFGIFETLTHFIIDYFSSSRMFGHNVDQLLHGTVLVLIACLWTKWEDLWI